MKNRVLNLILAAIVVLLTPGFGVTVQDIHAKPHVRNLTKVEYFTINAKAKGKSTDEVYKEVNAREASLQSTMQNNVLTENSTPANYYQQIDWEGVVAAKDPFVAATESGTFNWVPSHIVLRFFIIPAYMI